MVNLGPLKRVLTLSKDQAAEIRFCQEYAENFRHRTPGANRMILIARLALALGFSPINGELVAVNSPVELKVDDHDPFAT